MSVLSRKLTQPRKNSTPSIKIYLLHMYLAVKKFRYFIEGRTFALFTNHKPLKYMFNNVFDKWSPHQQRHICIVSEFSTGIRYVPGADNLVADSLADRS